VARPAAAAGRGPTPPGELRHTLATQAINRGMSLEAIAAMPGHRSPDMTLRHAKIASRAVADEYFAVTEKAEALYGQAPVLPAGAIGPKTARLRPEHHKMPANCYCTRPPPPPGPPRSKRSPRPPPTPRPAASPAPPCNPSTTTPSPGTNTTAGSCPPRCSPNPAGTRHEPAAPAPGPPRPAARAPGRR